MKYLCSAFLIFTLFSLSPSVFAYSDAGIEIQCRVNATCPCSTLTPDDINVLVTNLGTSRETYQLSLDLPAGGLWSGFIPPTITLSPEEQGSAGAIFITPSCGVEPGIYTLGVVANSTISDKSFSEEFEIEVLPCHWLEIEADEYELCQGIDSSFDIGITNDGISDEKIKVSASEEWVTFPVSMIEVEEGEKKTVEMLFSPPADEAGMKNVTISVESLTSYARREKTILTNIRECYSGAISIEPMRRDVCPCKTAGFSLKIGNTGLLEDTYVIMYNNQSSEISVGPGETGRVELSVDVPCDKEQGDYPVLITMDSRTPGKTSVTLGVLPMRDCYSVLLSTENSTKTVAVGKAVTYRFTITNNGKFSQVYELLIDAPGWVHLSDSRLELEPGGGGDVYLYAAPNYYTQAGNYSAAVSAVSEIEQAGLEFKVNVLSGFSFDINETPEGILSASNITMNISIPTGGIIAGEDEKETSWTQIMMLTILALGVVIILILRFVIMLK